MKYEHTTDVNIKRNPSSKTYIFKRGAIEKSLKTTDWKTALLRKKLQLAEFDFAGEVAFVHSFGEVWPDYREYKKDQRDGKINKRKKISHNTYREIEHIGRNQLEPFFGKMKLGKINSQTWTRFCDQVDLSDLSNPRKIMSGFIKWCMEKGYVQAMPMMRIPDHERRRRKNLKPEALEKIFEHSKGAMLVFISLALFNGLRRKEIRTLALDRVFVKERYIVIVGIFNKKRRERSLPINGFVADVLDKWVAQLPPNSKWLFPNKVDAKRHADVGGLKKQWAKVLVAAKLKDIQWHDLRATFEKHLNKNKDFTDMQKEKFADAKLDVQGKIYVSMDHEDLKGLEEAVNLPKLAEIVSKARGNKVDLHA